MIHTREVGSRGAETRKSPVEVDVLDLSAIGQKALEHLKKAPPMMAVPNVRDIELLDGGWGWARATTSGGVYVLCTEGVGPHHPINEQHPWVLDLYPRYKSGRLMAAGPAARVRLSEEDVRALPVLERVPLVEFVRTFGDRLEQNFWLWNDRLITAGIRGAA